MNTTNTDIKFPLKIISGTENNLQETLKGHEINELDIEDVITDTQLSKIEQRPKYLYASLHFPEFDKTKRRFFTKEVHCFVSEKEFLVINKHDYKYVTRFDNLKNILVKQPDHTFSIFYELVDYITTNIFRVMRKFRMEINDVENNLFDFEKNKDLLREILIIKRNLINFSSIVTPLRNALLDLQIKKGIYIDEDGIEKLDDTLDKIAKMLNNLGNFQDNLRLLVETNESLVNRSTNETIKILTSISLITLPPTILASFFGMNVYFGWTSDTNSLLPLISIISLMCLSSIILYIIFKKQRWI